MKSEKAMSYKMLIICVLIIAVLIITAGYFINNKVESEKIKTYQTDMLLIQGKVKVLFHT